MEYYVAPNGNDSNPGTLAEPWATPVKASQAAQAGDTVYFREGVYCRCTWRAGRRLR